MELIGRQFGHIRVTEVVGEGGMGAVYAGYDEKLDRKVALKVLHADQRLDEEARERLLREARALSKVDHPNICRIHDYIETGDVDLLVLEYIDGRTLQAAIEDGLPHSEKLRIASSVAEVLVRAHRAGIVHRDLKPENVMLTRTGEVKVLDFGLARWLQRGRKSESHPHAVSAPALYAVSEAPAHPSIGETMMLPAVRPSAAFASGRREFLATAVGITLGTPLYMSPEQARGESLTPASDMFSFGLLLQVLFTGKEPHPDFISAREVILRVARGETNPVEGAPKDIAALINSLKQFAPADRPTAVQMVEQLQLLITKPQRIARRAIAAVIAAIMLAGAWRYTVDLRYERAIAVKERAEAQKQRANAEELMEFMLGDLRKKLDQVGRLDILDDVGERVMQRAELLQPELMSAEELARNAKALNQMGEVRVGQGRTPEALYFFRRSLRFAQEAVNRAPDNAEALKVFGVTHFWIGNSQRLKGDLDSALVHMREYMKAGDKLAALQPAEKDAQLEKAYGHSSLAFVLEAKGEFKEALEHYKVSLGVREDVARRNPGDTSAQEEVARAYNKLAVLYYKIGDLRGALDYSRREVEIYRTLVSREPQQMQWKSRITTSLGYMARTLTYTGEADAARALWQETLTLQRELARHDPSNIDWQRNVAITSRWLVSDYARRGDVAGATALCAEAVAIMDEVLRKAPTRRSFVGEAMMVKTEYGRLLAEGGNRRGEEILREIAARLESMKDDRYAHYQLVRTSLTLGELLMARGSGEAAVWFEKAERELTPLVAGSSNPDDLALWTRVLIRRQRMDEARALLARLRTTGYATAQLEQLVFAKGS